MKQLLLVLVIAVGVTSGCGKIKKALDIPEKMDNLNKGMGDTNAAVRLQKMGVFLTMLLDEKNYAFLTPYPGQLMAAGKHLGEELTTQEALELFASQMKIINTYDINTNPLLDPNDSKDQIKFERQKLGLYMALTIVAGYLKDSVIDEVVHRIYVSDLYTEQGLQILALRAQFFSGVMLNGRMFSTKFKTLGHVSESIYFNSKIERIAQLPYPELIQVEVVGMLTPEMNEAMSVKFDPSIVATNWSKIKTLAEAGFEVKPMSGNAQADAAEKQRQTNEFNKMMSFLDTKINVKQQ